MSNYPKSTSGAGCKESKDTNGESTECHNEAHTHAGLTECEVNWLHGDIIMSKQMYDPGNLGDHIFLGGVVILLVEWVVHFHTVIWSLAPEVLTPHTCSVFALIGMNANE